jgi:heat shock protein HspQ
MAARLPSGLWRCFAVLACVARANPYIEIMSHIPHNAFQSRSPGAPPIATARFGIGEVVRHRIFDFRGVVFDVDPVFSNSEEWYQSIPEDIRPSRDQPFYHLLAENTESSYVAYVSQQNLIPDEDEGPVDHPAIAGMFEHFDGQKYPLKSVHRH